MCSNSRNIGFFDKFQRGMQSGDAVRIERARLEPCRIRLRLFAVVGVNAGTAAEQRSKLYTRPDAQAAGSLRTHQALVAGEAEHVNVHALHVDRYRTCRLRCIDNQKGTVCVRHCTDFGDIEQVSGQIGCMRADNGLGFRSKERFHILIADIALAVRRYKIHRYAARLQIIQRTEHGIVLQIGRNDVIAGRKQTVDCNIQRLGGVCGEHNMVRTRTAEQLRQLTPRLEHHARRGKRHTVCTARCISCGKDGVFDRLRDFRRLVQRGRCVIQINHDFLRQSNSSTRACVSNPMPVSHRASRSTCSSLVSAFHASPQPALT